MIPLVQGLEAMPLGDREIALELHGTKASVDTLNWQQDWPYCPAVHISVARSLSHLFIAYHVHGLDLSYNFEMNCIGTLLAAKRKSRTECTHFEAEKLDQVIKYSSLKREKIEISGKIFSWDIAMGIPFSLIGMDGKDLPKTARANFFKCADKAAHPHFLSWNPIDVPSPDFHRPDFFGELIF